MDQTNKIGFSFALLVCICFASFAFVNIAGGIMLLYFTFQVLPAVRDKYDYDQRKIAKEMTYMKYHEPKEEMAAPKEALTSEQITFWNDKGDLVVPITDDQKIWWYEVKDDKGKKERYVGFIKDRFVFLPIDSKDDRKDIFQAQKKNGPGGWFLKKDIMMLSANNQPEILMIKSIGMSPRNQLTICGTLIPDGNVDHLDKGEMVTMTHVKDEDIVKDLSKRIVKLLPE